MERQMVDDRGEQGGAAIEMLLLLPFIILLNCFIIQLSHLFIAYQVVQYGAFAAARAALVADVDPQSASPGSNWKNKAASGNEFDRPVRAAAQICSILELMAPPVTIKWHKNPIRFNKEGYSGLSLPLRKRILQAFARRVKAFAVARVGLPELPGLSSSPFDIEAASRSRSYGLGGGGGGGGGGGKAWPKYRYFLDDRARGFLSAVNVVLPRGPNEDEVRVSIVYNTFLPVPFANRIIYKAFSETGRAGSGDLRVQVIQSCVVVKPWW